MISLRNNLYLRRLSLEKIQRRFTSKLNHEEKTLTQVRDIPSEPPLPIRVALVSSSTALCTPIFPAIGFLNITVRAMFKNEQLRSNVSASVGSILSIACWTIVPFSYNIAPLLLPFAISNGISAGVGYAILDMSTGGPKVSKVLKNPVFTGGGIGAFTGFVAPNYLYGETYNVLYGIDSVTPFINQLMTSSYITQISIMTGFVAGCTMYPLLHYPIFGIKNVPWTNFSGLLLLLSAASAYKVYKTDVNKHAMIGEMFAPDGSFVKPEMVPSLNAIVRYNNQTKQFESFSLTTNEWVGNPDVCKKGRSLASSVKAYQKRADSWGKTFTFDNATLSFLCHYIDRGIADMFPKNMISVKDDPTLEKYSDVLYKTDLIVAFLNEKNVEQIMEEKVHQMGAAQNDWSESQCRKLMKTIASVSTGVEFFLAMKQQGINEIYSEHLKAVVTLNDIESWVKQRVPGILLFQSDEEDLSLKGESVESQLLRLAHKSEPIDQIFEKWEKTSTDERRSRWKVGIVATIGALATILSQVYLI